MIIGYARVSTETQSVESQTKRLKEYGCDKIFEEVQSGRIVHRPIFKDCLDFLRQRDSLVVCKLDRLGRTTKQLFELFNVLMDREIKFVSLDENIDITNPMGKLLFNMCAMMAEMEANSIKERTMAGLSAARARGKQGGRPPKIKDEKKEIFINMAANLNIPIGDICKHFGITRGTYYKYCKDWQINSMVCRDKQLKAKILYEEKYGKNVSKLRPTRADDL